MNLQRQALSLLEVVISLSLFGVVMAAVLQAMVTTTQYVDFDTARNNQETESLKLQNLILNDFANAAWFFKFDTKTMSLAIDSDTKLPTRKYPKVYSDVTAIEFLKLRTSTLVDPDPKKERYAYTNLRGSTATPVLFSRYVDALPTPLMVLNDQYRADPEWYVAPVWESSKSPLTFLQNQNPGYLRHYAYVIEANTRGTKSLVRKFYNYEGVTLPDAPDYVPDFTKWTLDSVLIDEVKEVKFSTIVEDESLNENQVRFEVTLEHERQGLSASTGANLTRRFEFTAAMRSIVQEN